MKHAETIARNRLLLMLVAADLAFVAIHVVARLWPEAVDSPLFLVTTERGYGEAFQYIKWFWVGFLLSLTAGVLRQGGYAVWGLVFLYLMADDSMGLHEQAGYWLSKEWGIASWGDLRGRDIGEILYSACVGVVMLSSVALVWWRGDRRLRSVSLTLVGLIAALAFFGVVADLLHRVIPGAWAGLFFEVLEDGGEMLVASLAVWVAYRLQARIAAPELSGAPSRPHGRPSPAFRWVRGTARAAHASD